MGIAQAGTAISDGGNLAIQGVKPSGIAAQGQTIWRAEQPWNLLNSTSLQHPRVTTPAIDTTGATLLIAVGAYYSTSLSGLSDSQNNSWNLAVDKISAPTYHTGSVIYYCLNPSTSSAHTFSWTPEFYNSMMIAAFGGPQALLDQVSSNATDGLVSSITSTPITPSSANSLVISAVTVNDSAPLPSLAIDSGFSIVLNNGAVSGNDSGAIAYLVQSQPASLSPTWSWTPSNPTATTMVSFKPS